MNVVYLTISHHEKNCVNLVIGSSCGYACLFCDPLNVNKPFHQEPVMLMEGIWNPKTKDDDAVISLCQMIPFVEMEKNEMCDVYALGAESGKVFLVANDQCVDGEYKSNQYYDFTCLWNIDLYHPIRAMRFAMKHDEDDAVPILIVVTEDTVHWFSSNTRTS